MRASFDKWWLLPVGILVASALVALGIIVFGPAFIGRSSGEAAQRGANEAASADCSGARSTDYACHQERYQDLVRDSGVEAAFAELKDEYEKNELAKAKCHQLAHVIGRAAAERYSDLSATYGRGDNFCFAGYYHGAMETFVAEIGAEKMLEEADTLCADLRGEHREHSFYHYNCVHGLGHGFMGVLGNEVFESLEACDVLRDAWERENCYGGVFMENLMIEHNTGHPSKYLDTDRPLYPCTDVETRYKNACYIAQSPYTLKTQGEDFARAFDLCATAAEDDFRPACYQGLGRAADGQSMTDVAKTEDACMLGEDYDARANCLIGAVTHSIAFYQSDERARALCGSVEADLRDVCFKTAEEFYGRF